jgi:hypothetical protein
MSGLTYWEFSFQNTKTQGPIYMKLLALTCLTKFMMMYIMHSKTSMKMDVDKKFKHKDLGGT